MGKRAAGGDSPRPTAAGGRAGETGPALWRVSEAQVGHRCPPFPHPCVLKCTELVWAGQLELERALWGNVQGSEDGPRAQLWWELALRLGGPPPGGWSWALSPQFPEPLFQVSFVTQKPLRAHLVPPSTFTGGELEAQRWTETCLKPHSKWIAADAGGNQAWAS